MGRVADEILMHYGVGALDGAPGRGSGRYPLGSGEDPNQHSGDFASRVQELRKSGMTDSDIVTALNLRSTTQLRAEYSTAVNNRRAARVSRARALLESGKSQGEVAREMGINESTLRSLLNERAAARTSAAKNTADFLRSQVTEKGMIDVGTGVERELGISREKMTQALAILQKDGYTVYGGGVEQVTNPGKQTHMLVLCPPGTAHKDIYQLENIHTVTDYTCREDADGTEHFDKKFEYPASMDSKRLLIRYHDDPLPNGHPAVEKDGTIEIRRGVADLDLGNCHYAQVRILVDGDKYIKGMAYYSDELPDGVDVAFNTNKPRGKEALKPISTKDPDNPFDSLLREEGGQYHYTDENGERKLGLINKTRQEGDWGDWGKNLPHQFLEKQSQQLIDKQLKLSLADKYGEFDAICQLTNPTVKKHLLETFANDCDSGAVHLKAAALPRQRYQVILPVSTMKDNEVYAPNYEDGETVALIRFPHAGTFEIPVLKVNNKQPDARRMLGTNPLDAVGINTKVAAQLSGADFDGDTVMVIPCNSSKSGVKIISREPFKELQDFDNKLEYGPASVTTDKNGEEHYFRNGREYKRMTSHQTQLEMGKISNLITDMTLKGATTEELIRAVRHSMVVIDAEKHKLDWRQSETDNDIPQLKQKYQLRVNEDGSVSAGASTLLSRAKSRYDIPRREGAGRIDPDTGEVVYKTDDKTWVDPKTGKLKRRTQQSTLMAEVKDAHSISSGTPQEEAYADYANHLKALANDARKELVATGRLKYSAAAKEVYRAEVGDLDAKLEIALLNAPRERQAQLAANSELNALKRANPGLKKKEIKKLGQLALARARTRFGARRHPIDISAKEWQAIQAGAVSENKLTQILRFADIDQVRTYATPRVSTALSSAKQAKISAMRASGYTTSEIAAALDVSTSTVTKYLK